MAKKANFLRQAHLIRAGFEIANRQPHPPTGALYLMQLRQQPLKIPSPKRRLGIPVESDPFSHIPQSVKIIHAA